MWCWLAWRVLLKIAYVLTCRVLSLAVLVFRGDLAKDAELLVLRHENAALPGGPSSSDQRANAESRRLTSRP